MKEVRVIDDGEPTGGSWIRLRDELAARAMVVALQKWDKPETVARISYEMADAMLAARKKGQ